MRQPSPRPPGILARIQHLADLAGSVTNLSSLSGHSRKTLTDWLREVRPPTTQGLKRLVDSLGINPEWLNEGNGIAPTELGRPLVSPFGIDLTPIEEPQVRSILSIDSGWLRWRLGVVPDLVILYNMPDESMFPLVDVGDPVICRKLPVIRSKDLRLPPDFLALIKYQDALYLRYAEREGLRSLCLHPRNPEFPIIKIKDWREASIVARVIWFGRNVSGMRENKQDRHSHGWYFDNSGIEKIRNEQDDFAAKGKVHREESQAREKSLKKTKPLH